MKEKVAIEFDDEKLRALDMVLRKEHSSVQQHLSRTLEELYEKKVPEPVREFIDSKTAAKVKRAVRPASKSVPGKQAEHKGDHHEQ